MNKNKPVKNPGGRPKTVLTEEQKHIAFKYAESAGFYKKSIAAILQIDRKTFDRILKLDKEFERDLKRADSIFFGNLVSRAKPEFILRTRFPEEFPDPPRSRKAPQDNAENQKLKEFLDRWESRQKLEGTSINATDETL